METTVRGTGSGKRRECGGRWAVHGGVTFWIRVMIVMSVVVRDVADRRRRREKGRA